MSLPPGPLLAHLNAWPQERWLGAQLTGSVHHFPADAQGKWRKAAIWACTTNERFWLVAHDDSLDQTWQVAVGRAGDVRLEEHWQRDILHVGAWSVASRRNSRKEVRALLKSWKREKPKGDPWPLSMPLPAEPAPRAAGAVAVSQHHANAVPSALVERWLLAVETDGTAPAPAFDTGSIPVPLTLMISDQRAVLIAAPPIGPASPINLPPEPLTRNKRAWVIAGRHLTPRASADVVELAEALLESTSPEVRWALAARHALISGAPRRALRLLKEAHSLHHSGRSYALLGQLAQTLEHTALASSAAHRALANNPDLDVAARIRLWDVEAPALSRSLSVHKVVWREVRAQVGAMLEDLATVPPAPDGLPWPPHSSTEVWGSAVALHDRVHEAQELWSTSRPRARAAAAHASLLTMEGSDTSADAWRHAALLARKRPGYSEKDALKHAISLDEQAPDRWMWAAWSRIDGSRATEQWARALELDPTGRHAFDHGLDAAAMRALSKVARSCSCFTVAADALRHAIEADPSHERCRPTLASIYEDDLDEAGLAADTVQQHAEDLDAGVFDSSETVRWELWVDVARLRAKAGQPDRSVQALRSALSEDFLTLETWAAVLSVPGVQLPAKLESWWRHIQRLLVGDAIDMYAPAPCEPAVPSSDDLDSLHPGGVGWHATLRHQLDPTETPKFDALTRGLDTLAEARAQDAADQLHALCEQLQVDPPPAYVFRGRGAFGVSAWPCKPPVLLVGHQHLNAEHERSLSNPELRFALAAELTHLACNHPLLSFDATVMGTSRSVYNSVNTVAGTAETVFDIVTLLPGLDQIKKVHTVFKIASTVFKARGTVDKAVNITGPVLTWLGIDGTDNKRALTREGLSGAALQFRIQAERVALLLTGDLRAAVRALLKESTASHHTLEHVERDGLVTLLAERDVPLAPDELIRVLALVEFAATRMPW